MPSYAALLGNKVEPEAVVKRDGSAVPFDRARIAAAIGRAQRAVGCDDSDLREELTRVVVEHLGAVLDRRQPSIEEIQDAVVWVMRESGNYDIALAYARYRDARERRRRLARLDGASSVAPNLHVVGRDGRRRPWDRELLITYLRDRLDLAVKAAADVATQVEADLVDNPHDEIGAPLLLSLVDAALLRSGAVEAAERRSPVRIERGRLRALLREGEGGNLPLLRAGEEAYAQLAICEDYPREVLRFYCHGRLWVDGLGDPLRGSEFTAALDGSSNPWQIIGHAFGLAVEAQASWRSVNLVMPPIILGHLERGATALVQPLERLSCLASCYLYCDGRTPLLDTWPFTGRHISLATYADDFLLLRRLQELGLNQISGPHLMQGGYRRRVAVKLAINAQGLEDNYSLMDALAMALVAAARVRQRQLASNAALAGADIRYAIFGLPPASPSNEYLERQVVQEGLRCGIALSRSANLPEEACEHLGRLFE